MAATVVSVLSVIVTSLAALGVTAGAAVWTFYRRRQWRQDRDNGASG